MEPLKFVPFSSAIHPGFWTSLTKIKLDVARLDEEPIKVHGSFTNSDPKGGGLPARLSVEWNAFELQTKTCWNIFNVPGSVVIKNTVESFKEVDKGGFIRVEGERIWKTVTGGEWLQNPNILARFSVLMFADLKKFLYYYWFSFPAFNLPSQVVVSSCKELKEVLTKEQDGTLSSLIRQDLSGEVYSLLHLEDKDIVKLLPLSSLGSQEGEVMVCVRDPSSHPSHPGWPVRNLVAAICYSFPHKVAGMRILCLRSQVKEGQVTLGNSLVLTLGVEGEENLFHPDSMPGVVGWERNEKQQMGPRLANMRATMDPVKMAEGSVNLNLKLMKWRLVPDLDLTRVMEARCLLIGSGTLGCGVARNLLGWGVKHITFVDNGKVSYSNPVRQSLFTFKDCQDGGRHKAEAAAERLSEIFPGVTSSGHVLSVPMPGHPISPSMETAVRADFDRLSDLVSSHNVIFLLMDSRESRWLPTIMSASHQDKIVINAALGFNSYLVMRHGVRGGVEGSGPELGCYFCNDIVAPADSTTDRTLDQQCTVTRPGASGVAASLAVELAVSCLAHPLGPLAPPGSESVLGQVPHTIRGWLNDYSQMIPTGPAFSQCTACSREVLDLFSKEGFELVRKVGESPQYLEDVTGLTSLKNDTNLMDEVLELADDDSISLGSDF